jgi:hypothetical protein
MEHLLGEMRNFQLQEPSRKRRASNARLRREKRRREKDATLNK